MRRRRGRRWLLPVMLCTPLFDRGGPAQTVPPPPALEVRQGAPIPGNPAPPGSSESLLGPPMPPAPRPIPGPADMGLPVGGRDVQVPQGLPINLATAMQLAGARPLDIAAATKQVEQALALNLQAKVLW